MNCKNMKIKTKKGKKYLFCRTKNSEISFYDCNGCEYKEYKMHNNCKNNVDKKKKCTVKPKTLCKNGFPVKRKPIKGHKHKLTKATDISMKVKKEVWERDNHKCIYCHCEVPLTCANSHFIKRSQLGLGIPQNIVSACPICHDKYDFGINVQDMVNYTREYLKSKYKVWNEDMLIYKKNQ